MIPIRNSEPLTAVGSYGLRSAPWCCYKGHSIAGQGQRQESRDAVRCRVQDGPA
ncbi:hypothetical protein CEXT_250521, partial [Caerostris extrusa]